MAYQTLASLPERLFESSIIMTSLIRVVPASVALLFAYCGIVEPNHCYAQTSGSGDMHGVAHAFNSCIHVPLQSKLIHCGGIRQLMFTPHGDDLISLSTSLKVWNAASGDQLKAIGAECNFDSFCLIRSGRFIATADTITEQHRTGRHNLALDRSPALRVWNIDTGAEVNCLKLQFPLTSYAITMSSLTAISNRDVVCVLIGYIDGEREASDPLSARKNRLVAWNCFSHTVMCDIAVDSEWRDVVGCDDDIACLRSDRAISAMNIRTKSFLWRIETVTEPDEPVRGGTEVHFLANDASKETPQGLVVQTRSKRGGIDADEAYARFAVNHRSGTRTDFRYSEDDQRRLQNDVPYLWNAFEPNGWFYVNEMNQTELVADVDSGGRVIIPVHLRQPTSRRGSLLMSSSPNAIATSAVTGRAALSFEDDDAVYLIDKGTGRQITTSKGRVTARGSNSLNDFVAIIDGTTLLDISSITGGIQNRNLPESVSGDVISISPDGHWCAVAAGGDITLWDCVTMTKATSITCSTHDVVELSFDSTGDIVRFIDAYGRIGDCKRHATQDDWKDATVGTVDCRLASPSNSDIALNGSASPLPRSMMSLTDRKAILFWGLPSISGKGGTRIRLNPTLGQTILGECASSDQQMGRRPPSVETGVLVSIDLQTGACSKCTPAFDESTQITGLRMSTNATYASFESNAGRVIVVDLDRRQYISFIDHGRNNILASEVLGECDHVLILTATGLLELWDATKPRRVITTQLESRYPIGMWAIVKRGYITAAVATLDMGVIICSFKM